MRLAILSFVVVVYASPLYAQQVKRYEAPLTGAQQDALKSATSCGLRIESPVSAKWSGVTGCCTGDTANREFQSGFNSWVGKQVQDHPDMIFAGAGHAGGRASCSSNNPLPGGANKCKGKFTAASWIEFKKAQ